MTLSRLGDSRGLAVARRNLGVAVMRQGNLEECRALLERAALATGGRLDPPVTGLFDPAGQLVTSREPLWQRFILLAIAGFLLDLLLRRVRIFDRQFHRRSQRNG